MFYGKLSNFDILLKAVKFWHFYVNLSNADVCLEIIKFWRFNESRKILNFIYSEPNFYVNKKKCSFMSNFDIYLQLIKFLRKHICQILRFILTFIENQIFT